MTEKMTATIIGLIDLIGSAATERLVDEFGGDCIYIPKCHKHFHHNRNLEILNDRKIGMKISELRKKYNLSRRRILEICSNETIAK